MKSAPSPATRRWAAALALVLLAAFALRVARLDHLPLWWDEGLTAHLSYLRPADLLDEMRITRHADPPLFPLAMSGWRALAGGSPLALRLLPAFLGVATVALTATAARRLAGQRAGLLAALLVAASPMQVYYTREAKSYAFGAFCALLSTYAWAFRLGYARPGGAAPQRRPLGWWVAYVASTTGAVGSHYYLGLVVLWQGLWVAGSTAVSLSRTRAAVRPLLARLGRWVLAAGVAGLLLAPAVLPLYESTVGGVRGVSRHDPLSPLHYVYRVLGEMSAGPNADGRLALIAGSLLLILSAGGVLAGHDRAFCLTWAAFPLAAAYAVQAAFSFFHPRFLVYAGPACAILVARALSVPPATRRVRAAAATALALLLVALGAPGLVQAYTAPPDAEDPRPVTGHLADAAQPGDALVYVYIWQSGYVHTYAPENALSLYRAYYTPETVGSELSTIFGSHRRLWLLSYLVAAEDAQNLSGTWLEGHAFRLERDWYGNHHLALYLAPDFIGEGVGPAEGDASFGGVAALRYPLVDARAEPGQALAVPLRWQALVAPGESYHVFVHVGLPDAPPLAQSDGPPRNGQSPTEGWEPGQVIVDRRTLLLPADAPPGRFRISVGLYRPADGARLPVDGDGADTVAIGHVEVAR